MTLDRICVSTWAFHTQFENGEIRLLDFPEMIADRYGVHNLEIVAPHFSDTDEAALRQRLARTKSRMVNIPIDIKELWETPSLSSPDPAVREHAIGLYSAWIDRAHALGVPSVRCDPGLLNLLDLAPTIASYRKLVEYGAARKVEVSVENHGSASAHPEQLAEVLRQSGAAALPDFGNFPERPPGSAVFASYSPWRSRFVTQNCSKTCKIASKLRKLAAFLAYFRSNRRMFRA